jgi:hypothetical protein
MSFSWIPMYEELATALMAYEGRQSELIQRLVDLKNEKLPVLPLNDKTADGDAMLAAIDPFSFFATFNRGLTDENRCAVLTRLKSHFGLSSEVPTDFDGIPVTDARSSWFFQYSVDRQPDEIPALWALARQAVTLGRMAIAEATFDRCLRIKTVKIGKLSMGLFWLRPREFMPLDSRSMAYLRSKDVHVPENVGSWTAYAKVLDDAEVVLGNDFSRLSLDAYDLDGPPSSTLRVAEPVERPLQSWLFQCNPDKYDLDGALKAMKRTSWRMSRYAEDIAVGDQVFLWVSGRAGGLRAVATVDSPVTEVASDDDTFIRDTAGLSETGKRVGIRFDKSSRLVHRDAVRAAPGLQNLGVLKSPQGTNYPVTPEEATILLGLYTREMTPPHPLNLILHGPPGTGKTYQMRKMREDFTEAWVSSNSSPSADNQFFVTFHPSFTYEDFVEGIRPESDDAGGPVRYPLCAGIFKQACERAVQLAGFDRGLAAFCSLPTAERKRLLAVARPAVLYIDEINRGNVARILGELISLIEPDKRLGADQELVVTLPGSRQYFGVPSNLWLIGTMNTADRSVVALDVALRRRFAFQECPPQPELLDGVLVDGVDLGRLLRTINRRLLFLRDRDHLIGHAFFLPLKTSPSLDALRRVFREAVIPLLLEYFHDDLGRVGLVLGPQWVRRIAGGNIFALGFDHDQRDDLSERPVWEVVDAKDQPIEAFRSIDG